MLYFLMLLFAATNLTLTFDAQLCVWIFFVLNLNCDLIVHI